MMENTRRYLLLILLILAVAGMSYAQGLEERLQKYGETFAKGYTKPFIDAFGASLNSGWYHTANVDDGLSLYLGVKVMLMPIPDDGKKFKIASPYNGVIQEIPTVFGEEIEVPMSGALPGIEPNKYPKGFNISAVPMAVPHIAIGNMFGTRVMFRYFPKTKLGDYGEFELFGAGVQHSVKQYFPLLPVDISGTLAFQSLSLGNLISANAFTFGAQVSKNFTVVTIYGGLAYERSSMSFGYDAKFADPTNPLGPMITKHIGFDDTGRNNFRATIGLGLDLLILKINADYSLAPQPVATAGIGFGW